MKPVRLLLLLCVSILTVSSITLVVLRAWCSSWKFGCGWICCSFNANKASSSTNPPVTEKVTVSFVTDKTVTESMSSYDTDVTTDHSTSSPLDSTSKEITASTLTIAEGNTAISLSIEIIVGSSFFVSIIVVLCIIVCCLIRQNRQVTQSLQRDVRTFLQRVPSTYNRVKGRRRRQQMQRYNDNRTSLNMVDNPSVTENSGIIGTLYKTERASSPHLLNQYCYSFEKNELDYRFSSGGEYRRSTRNATLKPPLAVSGYRGSPYLNVGSEANGRSMAVTEEIDVQEEEYDEVI
ncbi:hypothetical protein HOLleu_36653 [Holothuria leucospilota]|uniref:Uncharacterized protein n=1 Tax=Holothuria leucospilota TaxID=206669 RepID=A0A9Q0YM95_HOLLE|nr:hypothetical protein HOLleu_36653 [Holothuria leucospilota]